MKTLTRHTLVIESPRQIRALASAVRQDVVDALEANGPCTVREVAELLGRRPDALYYHIRALLDVGLLVEVVPVGDADSGTTVDVAFRPVSIRYDLDDRVNREGVCRVVGAMARSAQRSFRKAFRPGHAQAEGPDRNLWAGRCQGWLSKQDTREVNRLLARIQSIMRARQVPTSREATRQEVTFIFAPLPTTQAAKRA